MKSLFTLIVVFALSASTAFAQFIYGTQAADLTFTSRINAAKGVDIPSGSTVDLNAVAGNLVHITGASTISSFGVPLQAGITRNVIFDGINSIVYNASTLVVPGSTTFNTAAGDFALIAADSTSKWIILDYRRKATAP